MFNLRCSGELDSAYDRPGSLAFRPNQQRIWDYSIKNFQFPVRTLDWHDQSQSDPKDYDYVNADKKNIFRSTYNQIGYYGKDWFIPKPTTQEILENVLYFDKKKESANKPLSNEESKLLLNSERLEFIKSSPSSANKRKMYLNSTYKTDFQAPFPLQELQPKTNENRWDQLVSAGVFRRCKPNPKSGVEKWSDENTRCPFLHLKREIAKLKSNR